MNHEKCLTTLLIKVQLKLSFGANLNKPLSSHLHLAPSLRPEDSGVCVLCKLISFILLIKGTIIFIKVELFENIWMDTCV